VFILRLNPKARKTAILLCLVGIILIPLYLRPAVTPFAVLLSANDYGKNLADYFAEYKD